MTTAAKKILDEALTLPEDDRRHVAERLLDSVRESPKDVELAWDEEVLRRIKTAEQGDTKGRDWKEARAELRAKHARK